MISKARKAELTAIAERRRHNLHEPPSPGDVVWLDHEEQVFFDAHTAKLERRDATLHAKQLEQKAGDVRAAIRGELATLTTLPTNTGDLHQVIKKELASVKKPLSEIRAAITTEQERRSTRNRRNGEKGGRPPEEKPETLEKVLRHARGLTLKDFPLSRALELAAKKYGATTGVPSLRKHYNKKYKTR